MPKYKKCSATRKRRYRDSIAAKLALASAGRAGRDEKRVYFCKFCKGWHVTSQPFKERESPKVLTTSGRMA